MPLLQGALVATNLLLNMVFQISLKITIYTKAMRVGTLLCFVVVMFQLADVGPTPRDEDVDIFEMMSSSSAILWSITLAAFTILSGMGMYFTKQEPPEDLTKVFMWALHIGVLGAFTDNGASALGVMSGWILPASLAVFGLLSIYILGVSAKAPAVCDASTYVPLQLSLQLVLNMVTGILVWEDLDRMNGKPLKPYFVTLVVIVFSVYVASPTADLVEGVVRWRVLRTTTLSKDVATSTFGKSVLKLLHCWRNVRTSPGTDSEDAARRALRQMLSVGAERGLFTSKDLLDLAIAIKRETGTYAASAAMLRWFHDNNLFNAFLRTDPTLKKQLLELLDEHERNKLPASFISVAGSGMLNDVQLATPINSFHVEPADVESF